MGIRLNEVLGGSPARGAIPALAGALLLLPLLSSALLPAARALGSPRQQHGSCSQQHQPRLSACLPNPVCVPQYTLCCFFLPLPSDRGVRAFSPQRQQ